MSEVWALMQQHKTHHVFVLDGESILGIISDRDVRRALPSPLAATGVEDYDSLLKNVKASTIMTRAPETIAGASRLTDALAMFLEGNYHALPVVNGRKLTGILTTHDCIRVFAEHLAQVDS